MTNPSIVFRCDGGPKMGGGHVARCLALAGELKKRGWRCVFVVSAETAATMPALIAAGHPLQILPPSLSADDEPAEMAVHNPDGCDLLIVDHYRRDARFETGCRNWATHILVIDDLADRPHDCDWLLDPTLGRNPGDYRTQVPAACQLLLGPGYALLRPEFAAARPLSLARRRRKPGLRRVLLSFGSTDPDNATGACLDALARLPLGLGIDVVLGSAAPHLETIRQRVAGMANTKLHIDTTAMADLMAQADCALGGAGSTSWERCCLGLPAIAVVLADNQRGIARALSLAGAAIVPGDWRPELAGKLLDELFSLTSQRLFDMSRAAAVICDGSGIFRLANALDPLRRGLA